MSTIVLSSAHAFLADIPPIPVPPPPGLPLAAPASWLVSMALWAVALVAIGALWLWKRRRAQPAVNAPGGHDRP